ncbi:MAG: hypothetical protein R2865_12425 [Deinococcales bacterium]
MAIFGSLDDLPLLELLGMLEKRTGKLRLSAIGPYQQIEIYLEAASLKGLRLDGEFVPENELAQAMHELLRPSRAFEFERLEGLELEAQANIPLSQLLSAPEDAARYQERLANPQTRFKSSERPDIVIEPP